MFVLFTVRYGKTVVPASSHREQQILPIVAPQPNRKRDARGSVLHPRVQGGGGAWSASPNGVVFRNVMWRVMWRIELSIQGPRQRSPLPGSPPRYAIQATTPSAVEAELAVLQPVRAVLLVHPQQLEGHLRLLAGFHLPVHVGPIRQWTGHRGRWGGRLPARSPTVTPLSMECHGQLLLCMDIDHIPLALGRAEPAMPL